MQARGERAALPTLLRCPHAGWGHAEGSAQKNGHPIGERSSTAWKHPNYDAISFMISSANSKRPVDLPQPDTTALSSSERCPVLVHSLDSEKINAVVTSPTDEA